MSTETSTQTRTAMDPRVAQRRRDLAGERMRKRRRIVLGVLIGIIVLGVAVGVWFTPFLDVDRVVVRGNTVLGDDVIRQASGVRVGEPTVLVRPGTVDRRVERLPYVDTVRVKRVFPGTIIITVRERAEVAWTMRPDGSIGVLDATGRVLADLPTPPANLPRIDGLADVPAPGRRVQPADVPGVVAQLPPGLRSLVAVVVVDPSGVTLKLVDDLEVRLGDTANIPAKGAVAEAVIDRSVAGTRVVDVRVPTSPVSK
jgi:cell division protein FtsQ